MDSFEHAMIAQPSRFFVLLALVAALAACKREAETPRIDAGEPTAVVEAGVAALRKGDLRAFLESQLPPSEIERLRAEHAAQAGEPVDEADRQRFASWMGDLTAPDAEDRVMAAIEPQLQQFEREIEPQLARNVGMLKGLAMVAIQQNEDLGPLAKRQAVASLDALAGWVSSTRFTDRARLRESIGHLAAAAREADVASLDALNALDWDASLDRASIAFRGVKRVLETYGFPVDATLDSVRAEVLSQDGDRARIKVGYELLGQPMSFDVDLVARDGRWYAKDTLMAVDRAESGVAAGG
jgi:hypothetical protein